MYPTIDTQHSAEAVALLTDHYRTKLNVPGLVKSFMVPIQELENVFWSLIESFLLANSPVGDQLNKLGTIVGASRDPGMSDADYLAVVLLQIRVNRSQGLSLDVIDVVTLALAPYSKPLYVDYTQPGGTTIPVQGASFSVDIYQLLSDPNVLARLLSHTRAVGTYGTLHYSSYPPFLVFTWGSRYTSSVGTGGWGSVYSSITGGVLGAGSAI